MPTTDELHALTMANTADIASLKSRIEHHASALDRHETQIGRQDEQITLMRETMAKMATKEDITNLRDDINKSHIKQLEAAADSVPKNFAMAVSASGFLLALVTFALTHFSK